jgi:phosphoglycolate phosphatase-like HAD superfamily hydrolase
MPRRARPCAAILDLDGTLVDSNDAHARAWVDAFREAGCSDVTFELVRPLIGMGPDGLLPRAIGVSPQSELGHRVLTRRSYLFSHYYLPGITPFDGVRALLVRMSRAGLRRVVATSGSEEQAMDVLAAAGVTDLIDDVVSGSDVTGTRPHGELVERAVARAGCRPESALLLGDTPYDVEAGHRAGVEVVALRCGGWGDASLQGAVDIYDDARDILYHFSTSPFSAVRSIEFVPRRRVWVETRRARRA